MMPAKGQGSSRCKGKEITSDDPATKDVGKEAPYPESECSDEGEGRCDLDSECAPLIYPWYDTYAHFPKVLGEYTPPLPGRVVSVCSIKMVLTVT